MTAACGPSNFFLFKDKVCGQTLSEVENPIGFTTTMKNFRRNFSAVEYRNSTTKKGSKHYHP
jgi:hypothetical protein